MPYLLQKRRKCSWYKLFIHKAVVKKSQRPKTAKNMLVQEEKMREEMGKGSVDRSLVMIYLENL